MAISNFATETMEISEITEIMETMEIMEITETLEVEITEIMETLEVEITETMEIMEVEISEIMEIMEILVDGIIGPLVEEVGLVMEAANQVILEELEVAVWIVFLMEMCEILEPKIPVLLIRFDRFLPELLSLVMLENKSLIFTNFRLFRRFF